MDRRISGRKDIRCDAVFDDGAVGGIFRKICEFHIPGIRTVALSHSRIDRPFSSDQQDHRQIVRTHTVGVMIILP